MKVRGGPAAVNGDESCEQPLGCVNSREGTVSRLIHKPEDLPDQYGIAASGRGVAEFSLQGEEAGCNPQGWYHWL